MKQFEFFDNEVPHFQNWAVETLQDMGCHAQLIEGDAKHPGIPDLSVGIKHGLEVWAELKCWKKEHDCYDLVKTAMRKERELTAQQRSWLLKRQSMGGSLCGVLVAWRTKHGAAYVSFVPIEDWEHVLDWNLATLALSEYTETLNRLLRWDSSLYTMFRLVARNAGRP